MGRKIFVGKIGQKLIFNRKSKECDRSNTNGNVGAYLFFKLLFENNKNDTFYVIGDNDLNTFKNEYENVIDASKYTMLELMNIKPDVGVFLIGLLNEMNPGNKVIEFINVSKIRWLLVSDDPRCLDTKAKDIKNLPRKIISQFSGSIDFCGKNYFVEYVPIETASCYGCDFLQDSIKEKDFIVVANTAGDYDRLGIVDNLTDGIENVEIFGRIDKDEYKSDKRFKGEVKFSEMQEIMRSTKTTLLVPIKPGWVTSKYIEALMNGVVPIFYKDYGIGILPFMYFSLVIHNKKQLSYIVNLLCTNSEYTNHILESLRSHYIYPYSDGKKLNKMINDILVRM